jgi:quercetin dioxygenase-like cupin family protein
MNNTDNEIEKSKPHVAVELIKYVPQSVVSKSIIHKPTGNIRIVAFDKGEELTSKTSPFDIYAQIIDGRAEIIIDGKPFTLGKGQVIIMPAHTTSIMKAIERFKIQFTIIKSGYE